MELPAALGADGPRASTWQKTSPATPGATTKPQLSRQLLNLGAPLAHRSLHERSHHKRIQNACSNYITNYTKSWGTSEDQCLQEISPAWCSWCHGHFVINGEWGCFSYYVE